MKKRYFALLLRCKQRLNITPQLAAFEPAACCYNLRSYAAIAFTACCYSLHSYAATTELHHETMVSWLEMIISWLDTMVSWHDTTNIIYCTVHFKHNATRWRN